MTLLSVLLEALVQQRAIARERAAAAPPVPRPRGTAWSAIRVSLMTVLLALIPACAAVKPVDIDTTSDSCTRCRMAIDGLAHAGEIITADGNVRKYDSLGCLLADYRDLASAGRRLAGAWVADYETKAWLKAEAAYYALAGLPTDHMGFGAAAVSTREAALKIAAGDTAKVMDWQGLLLRRPE